MSVLKKCAFFVLNLAVFNLLLVKKISADVLPGPPNTSPIECSGCNKPPGCKCGTGGPPPLSERVCDNKGNLHPTGCYAKLRACSDPSVKYGSKSFNPITSTTCEITQPKNPALLTLKDLPPVPGPPGSFYLVKCPVCANRGCPCEMHPKMSICASDGFWYKNPCYPSSHTCEQTGMMFASKTFDIDGVDGDQIRCHILPAPTKEVPSSPFIISA